MLDQLPVTHQVRLSVAFKDSKGNPAQVDEAPQWVTDNPAVLALVPDPDGMSCLVKAIGPMSSTPTTVTVAADADLGEGIKTIFGTFVINQVTPGEAAVVEVTGGTPEPQPEEPLSPSAAAKAGAKGKKAK